MPARFGDMLQNRRRQMGLSIQQVANTIKIRPQIIEFFETGDFASMPPRGYAQGMISSYARYLGLNPREVVNAYFDDLRAYEQETAHAGGRLAEAAGHVSPRSASAETGRYLMVDAVPRSRYAQRPPQAGYVSEGTSGHEPQRVGYRPQPGATRQLPQAGPRFASYGRAGDPDPYATGRMPRTGGADRTQMVPRAGYGAARPGARRTGGGTGAPRGGRGTVPPRGRAPRSGQPPRRGSSRGRSGSGGVLADGRVLIALLIAAAAIIVLLLVLVVRGCTAPAATDDATSQAPVTAAGSSDAADGTDSGDAADANANAIADAGQDGDANGDGTDTTGDEDADDSTATDGTAAANGQGTDGTANGDGTDPAAADDGAAETQQTVVRISVADGDSSWLEVRLDGQVVFGNEVYGPYEQEYTVTDSIRITANTPGSVSVTENGEAVRWDTSTSGVARINITAPQPAATDGGGTTDGTDANADGTATAGAASTGTGAAAGTGTTAATNTTAQ